MHIVNLIENPVGSFRFLNAARRGGVPNVERISVLQAECDGIPNDLDAIIAAADLQGLEHWETANGQPPRLMGEVIPRLLVEQVLPDLKLDADRIGIFLCGDLYTVPGATKRGGTGDVQSVWHAFADQFRWVAGVAGNHDTYGNDKHANPSFPDGMEFLDASSVEVDGLKIGGLGGVIGSPERVRRRTKDDYCELLELLLSDSDPEVILMHDGCDGPVPGQKGSPAIREVLTRNDPKLVIRGHAHWKTPLAELDNGTQVLNVDSRVVILQRS